MQKTITIEGMGCPHCEAKVRKALEAVEGVEETLASHIEKNAVVTLSAPVDDSVLMDAVNATGRFRAVSVI